MSYRITEEGKEYIEKEVKEFKEKQPEEYEKFTKVADKLIKKHYLEKKSLKRKIFSIIRKRSKKH